MLSCTWKYGKFWCPSSSRENPVQVKSEDDFYPVTALFLVEFTNQQGAAVKMIGDLSNGSLITKSLLLCGD